MNPRDLEKLLEKAAYELAWRSGRYQPDYQHPLVVEIFEALDELHHREALSRLRSEARARVSQPDQCGAVRRPLHPSSEA